jgi:hypothetical protein
MMELDLAGTRQIDEPTEKDLAEALDSLETLGTPFIILTDDAFENAFMQAAMTDEGLIVEFRDGQSGRHYKSMKGMTGEAALSLFLAFLRQQDSYVKDCQWEDITDRLKRSRRTQWVALVIAIVVLGLLLFFLAGSFFAWW